MGYAMRGQPHSVAVVRHAGWRGQLGGMSRNQGVTILLSDTAWVGRFSSGVSLLHETQLRLP